MPFIKYAAASVTQPQITGRSWSKVRKASKPKTTLSKNLIEQASEILGQPFDPSKYLLSHATIVASVDVESVPNAKLGSVTEDGQRIMRKFSDFRIKTECDKFVNNNHDAWTRGVLLKAYKSFVGGHNFLEHIQLEELSKGRIIDAVARDIGPSLYIDILVATDRQHKELIKDIISGKVATLSMGCFLPGTQVSLDNGTRVPIEDIQIGDMVITHTGKAKRVDNKHQMRSAWKVQSVEAVGLPSAITATVNHEFLVFRPASICGCGCGESIDPRHHVDPARRMGQRFKRGHQMRIFNPNDPTKNSEEAKQDLERLKSWKPEWVRADEIEIGDYLCFPRSRDVENAEGASIGKARLLGYFLAEGCYIKREGKPVEVQFHFGLKEKDTFAAETVELLQREFPDANSPWLQDREDRNTCTVHCSGQEMVAWFYRHAGEYSHGKKISAEVMSWPTHILGHLVGAWINGDGCLVKDGGGSISAATVSYSLATQLQTVLSRCGVYSRLECSIKGSPRQPSGVVVDGIGIRDEKTGKLPAFFIKVGNTEAPKLREFTSKTPESSHFDGSLNVVDDYILYKVKSSEASVYEGWVYDLGIEDDHSYVVEGAVVHNCFTNFTICTTCGHVAADETEVCKHIRFMKGSTFYDDKNQKHRVAELCGHESEEDGGVQFIEASWVEVPAFTGAVLRNVLEAKDVSPEVLKQAELVLSSPPAQWQEDKYQKAANVLQTLKKGDWGDPDEDEGGDADDGGGGGDPFGDLENDIQKMVLDKVKKRVREQLREDEVADLSPEDSTAEPNDNVVKQAAQDRRDVAYRAAVFALVRTASSDIEFIEKLAKYNASVGIQVPVDLYRTTLKVGTQDKHALLRHFLGSCRAAFGRMPKSSEQQTLIRLGKFISEKGDH